MDKEYYDMVNDFTQRVLDELWDYNLPVDLHKICGYYNISVHPLKQESNALGGLTLC